MATRYRNPYRVNYKKYEPYYSCQDCGEKFHDSNQLCAHRQSCRYKERKLPPSSAGERLPYKERVVCSTHTGATT